MKVFYKLEYSDFPEARAGVVLDVVSAGSGRYYVPKWKINIEAKYCKVLPEEERNEFGIVSP